MSTSMTCGTYEDQNILNSFFEGAKAGAQLGRHNGKNQYGRQSLSDFVITPKTKSHRIMSEGSFYMFLTTMIPNLNSVLT